MSRPLRIEFSGAVYHITSRGNAREPIFTEEGDFADFLNILSTIVKRYNWILHSYCLMSNHYHLLIETLEGNLSRGMRQLNGIYTQKFNRKHNRVGHILQGRYKSILVEKDSHLLELCRYVVLNPVMAKIAKRPEEWRWSSYKVTLGRDKGYPCLTTDWILSQFHKDRETARERYKIFVSQGIKSESPWKDMRGEMLLGSRTFIEKHKKLITEKEEIKEIPKAQRYATRPLLDEIFKKAEQDKASIDRAIYNAYTAYGYRLKEIGDHLYVHYSTVSRAIKRME
jgi:REP element-mobilizing transposase RayT